MQPPADRRDGRCRVVAMTAVGLIGCGGIAQDVLAALRASPANGVSIVGALARPGRGEAARARLCGIDVVEALGDLLARGPALVAEVAGQSAVAEHGDAVLRSGVDCLVISVGALADPALFARCGPPRMTAAVAFCCRRAPSAASTPSRPCGSPA
jgi:Predicted dinucleotide-utilizing enzyme